MRAIRGQVAIGAAFGLVAAALVSAGLLGRWVGALRAEMAEQYRPLAMPLSEIPSQLGPYELLSDTPPLPEVLQMLRVDRFINRGYADTESGRRVSLWLGYWGVGEVRMHGPQICYPSSGWKAEADPRERAVQFDGRDGPSRVVMGQHRFGRTGPAGREFCAVGSLAVLDGEFRKSGRRVFWHSPRTATGDRRYSAQVLLSTNVLNGDWEAAEQDISTFMELLLPHLTVCLSVAGI